MRNLLQQARMELLPGHPAQPGLPRELSVGARPALDTGYFPETREDTFESYCEEHFDPNYGVYWASLKAGCPRNFTPELVAALRQGQLRVERRIRAELESGDESRLRYQVLSSRIPGIFSLGGDLALFKRLIRNQDRDSLLRYARGCIDLVYTNAVNYRLPVVTISLVQGQALGGGLEAALAANVVVAERQSKLGLPEVMFNMFPGMGAYQLLTRRLTPAKAEELILSGRTYAAEELYDLGLVDILAEPGEGEAAVMQFIKKRHRMFHAHQGLRRAIQAASPLDYEGLARVTEVWVDQAMGLEERDLELMDYLVRAQQRMKH